ncbi:hypothetical protein AGMMS50256_22500 [Betaproteobacteria bacterium]|nr:hypothetical protein AGMMS50256_22500 [Betaproteobacteria bacterium]
MNARVDFPCIDTATGIATWLLQAIDPDTGEVMQDAPRSYEANGLFTQASQGLPGQVAANQVSNLRSVLAPFTLRGLADGFTGSATDIGAPDEI